MTDTDIIKKPLSILHLEDNPKDAELVRALLEADGLECNITRVQSRDEFDSAITRGSWDLIISDFSLPSFDGLLALALLREKSSNVPFILVSGTVGEDVAVTSLHEGAADYLLKQRLERLPSAVRRALREVRHRSEREHSATALRKSHEHYLRVVEDIFRFVPESLLVFTGNMDLYKHNKAFEDLVRSYAQKLNYTEPELRELILREIRAKVLMVDSGEIRIPPKRRDGKGTRGPDHSGKGTEPAAQQISGLS